VLWKLRDPGAGAKRAGTAAAEITVWVQWRAADSVPPKRSVDFFAPPRDDFLLGGKPAYMGES
jgi:hypothetical protein